jgi:hypothetical protein
LSQIVAAQGLAIQRAINCNAGLGKLLLHLGHDLAEVVDPAVLAELGQQGTGVEAHGAAGVEQGVHVHKAWSVSPMSCRNCREGPPKARINLLSGWTLKSLATVTGRSG